MARGLSAGYEQYIFKFSSTPSSNGGIAKARGGLRIGLLIEGPTQLLLLQRNTWPYMLS